MEKRPNIIMLMTDQQRYDSISALGFPYMHTPAMDKIVENGTTFECAYAPGATCVASRASIFTGMYPHNHGVYAFNNWGHQRSLVQDLNESGYHCVNIGKMHHSPRDTMQGFHERVIVENPTGSPVVHGGVDDDWGRFLSYNGGYRPYGRNYSDPDWVKKHQCVPWEQDPNLQSDVFIGNSALAWINRHVVKEDKPIFLQVGFTGPHEPYDPLPEVYDKYYKGKEMPKAIKQPDGLVSKPPQQRAMRYHFWTAKHESQIDMKHLTDEEVAETRRHYYAKISTVDQKLGEVIDALEKKGLLENAVVFFFTDHGDMLGDYGMAYKWLMYDSIIHVPFVVWDTRINKPQRTNELVSLIDVAPTVLEYAGIKAKQYHDGVSLKNAVSTGEVPKHKNVLCQDNFITMMRNDRYKLVYYTYQPDDGELYDLEKDPTEIDNLYHKEEFSELLKDMHLELLAKVMESNYNNACYKTKQYDACYPRPQKGKTYMFYPPNGHADDDFNCMLED